MLVSAAAWPQQERAREHPRSRRLILAQSHRGAPGPSASATSGEAMRVFSASIETFLGKLRVFAKAILRDEFGVRVTRTRFHTPGGWSWPLVLVAIDDAQRLGYFDPRGCTIGVNKCLMYTAKDRVIKDLLRHELAHYFTYIAHHASGIDYTAHGREFQATCNTYGLAAEIRLATLDVRSANDAITGELANEAVIAKFRKLMSLSESDNPHEAELAILRANELMVKHNLDASAAQHGAQEDVEYCVACVIECKRSSPRISAIAEILGEFFVYPVHGSEGLEVTGTRANVEHAQYVASYLDRELAAAWKRARAERPRGALREKPFMAALAAAYRKKLRAATRSLPSADQRALVLMGEELAWAGRGVYGGGLQQSSSFYATCAESTARGAHAGSKLEIRRGVGGAGVTRLLGG